MKKWVLVAVLFGFSAIISCTLNNSEVALTSTSPIPAEIPGYLSTSLVITRNEKIYNVLLGYDFTGEAFRNTTPQPALDIDQLRSTVRDIRGIRLTRYGDFDKDGETEYLVFADERNQSIFENLLIFAIDYDSFNDEYRIFDEIKSSPNNVASIKDIEQDGNPEIIQKDEVFNLAMDGSEAEVIFAPIKIYRYNGKEFISVNQEYPDLVEKDANNYLKLMDSKSEFLFPNWYASYLADMYLLGKRDEGIKVFNELCINRLQPNMMLELHPEMNWNCEQFLDKIQDALSKSGYNQ